MNTGKSVQNGEIWLVKFDPSVGLSFKVSALL